MSDIFFLVLRRLRAPLILLICVYSVATLGMTLIPGQTPSGEIWHMNFFHAFYFVSFMGTTIGFGEIPYEFTDAQRIWVLVSIYTSVISWLYGVGTVLKLVQDDTFLHAVAQQAFQRNIKRITTPFYIICGYGETGRLINKGLSDLDIQTVIIDHDPERIRSIELEDLSIDPIVMRADITEPRNLQTSGIDHPMCQGVIAVTQNDHINLQVAVASKLIQQRVKVICRSEIQDEADNMASFGTNVIINPYLTFARRLSLLTKNPELHKIQNWFINQHSSEHISNDIIIDGLPKGRWILCGFGRFGKAVYDLLNSDDIEIVVVDANPIKNNAPEHTIVGRGTEAQTLIDAGINEATVVIAATSDDTNNLSILMTAKQLNNDALAVGRVSREVNHSLFLDADCDYVMRRSQIIANQTLTIISRPLVTKFIKYSSSLNKNETHELINNIDQLTDSKAPITWRLIINQKNAPAIARYLEQQGSLAIEDLSDNAALPNVRAIPLLLERNGVSHLLPKLDCKLQKNDEILWCCNRHHNHLAQRLKDNDELLDTLINKNPHHIPLLRWLSRKKLQ